MDSCSSAAASRRVRSSSSSKLLKSLPYTHHHATGQQTKKGHGKIVYRERSIEREEAPWLTCL